MASAAVHKSSEDWSIQRYKCRRPRQRSAYKLTTRMLLFAVSTLSAIFLGHDVVVTGSFVVSRDGICRNPHSASARGRPSLPHFLMSSQRRTTFVMSPSNTQRSALGASSSSATSKTTYTPKYSRFNTKGNAQGKTTTKTKTVSKNWEKLRSVIRSIEYIGQDNTDTVDDDDDDYSDMQGQQCQRPCSQLLAILRLLYHAGTPRQVSEAGRELEDLLLINPRETVDDREIPETTIVWKQNTSRRVQERIIKVCALAGLNKLAIALLRQLLLEENYLPKSVSYLPVCQLLKTLGRCDQLRDILLDLASVAKATGQHVDVIAFNTYLACLCRHVKPQKQGNLQVALSYLSPTTSSSSSADETLVAQDVFAINEVDTVSYNTILHGTALASNKTLADLLWKDMKSRQQSGSLELDIQSFNTRLQTFGNNDQTTRLQFIQDELLLLSNDDGGNMGKKRAEDGSVSDPTPIKPDSYTIDFVLKPLIRAGRIGDVEGLLDSFVSSHSERVVAEAFAVFFNTLVKSGEVYTARALFDTYVLPSVQLRQKQQISERESSALSYLSGRTSNSKALLVLPTVKQFNILIDGYRRMAELCTKKQLLQDIQKGKQNTNKSGGTSSTKSKNMESENDKPDVDDEGEAIDPDVARREGLALYRLMVDQARLTPDDYTLSSMIGLCTTPEELTRLLFFQSVDKNRADSRNDELDLLKIPAVLRTAITAYGKLGDPSASCILFDTIGAHKVDTNNTRMWNVLLGALMEGAKRNNVRLVLNRREDDPTNLLNFLDAKGNVRSRNGRKNPARSAIDMASMSPLFTLIHGKTCTEAVEVLLEQMTSLESQSSPRSAPSPNTQTYCIAASALQHSPTANAAMAMQLFRNATSTPGVSADGRFVNALLRCFGGDIDAALEAWKGELRKACLEFENRPRSEPPSNQRAPSKNLVAAYNGLLYVCGRAIRPDIAVRIAYAMNREGLEPNDVSLNCYNAGKRRSLRTDKNRRTTSDDGTEKREEYSPSTVGVPESNRFGFASKLKLKASKLIPKLDFVDQYENLLYVECTKYDRNDRRREGDKRVRIIV